MHCVPHSSIMACKSSRFILVFPSAERFSIKPIASQIKGYYKLALLRPFTVVWELYYFILISNTINYHVKGIRLRQVWFQTGNAFTKYICCGFFSEQFLIKLFSIKGIDDRKGLKEIKICKVFYDFRWQASKMRLYQLKKLTLHFKESQERKNVLQKSA